MKCKDLPTMAAAAGAFASSLGMTVTAIAWPLLHIDPTIVVPSIVILGSGTVFFTVCGAICIVMNHDPSESPASAPPTPVPLRLTPRNWVQTQRFSWSQRGRKPSTSKRNSTSANTAPALLPPTPPPQTTGPVNAIQLTITVIPPGETTSPPETTGPIVQRQPLRPLSSTLNNQPPPSALGDFFYATSPASYLTDPMRAYNPDGTVPRKNS